MPPRFGGMKTYNWEGVNPDGYFLDKLEPIPSVFFFQAEVGIRDLTVTGVQTVLFRSREKCASRWRPRAPDRAGAAARYSRARGVAPPGATRASRSEERRVGKSVDLGGGSIIKKKKEVNPDYYFLDNLEPIPTALQSLQ